MNAEPAIDPTAWMDGLCPSHFALAGRHHFDGWLLATNGFAFVLVRGSAVAAEVPNAELFRQWVNRPRVSEATIPFSRLIEWLGPTEGDGQQNMGRILDILVDRELVRRFLGPLTAETVCIETVSDNSEPLVIRDQADTWRIYVMPIAEHIRIPELVQ